MTARWIVDGGNVISQYDGQRHYVSAGQVARLHRLAYHQWARRIGDEKPHLYPRYDGDYRDLRGVAPPPTEADE